MKERERECPQGSGISKRSEGGRERSKKAQAAKPHWDSSKSPAVDQMPEVRPGGVR